MNPLSHPLEPEELMAYADGELRPDHASKVAAHLQECVDCAAASDEIGNLSLQMRTWGVGEPSDRISEVILGEVQERAERPIRRRWFVSTSPSYALALSAVGLCIAASLAVSKWESTIPAPAVVASTPADPQAARESGSRPESSAKAASGAVEIAAEVISQEGMGLMAGAIVAASPPSGLVMGGGDYVPDRRQPSPVVDAGVTPDLMILRTIRLTLVTKSFEGLEAAIDALLRPRGTIDGLTVQADAGSPRTLSAVLRIPSDQLESSLTELKKLGQVMEEAQSHTVVTSDYLDLVQRLSDARSAEQRLLATLKEPAGAVNDVAGLETEIAQLREQIQRMSAEQEDFRNKAGSVTIQLEIHEE